MISAIVLAAGLSQRMGDFKQLLPYGDHTVIEQVVSVLQKCPVDETVVVLGHRHREVENVLSKWRVRTIFNPSYEEGMLSSLQAGWRAVRPHTDAALHVLGDQPQLDSQIVHQLIAAFRKERARIIIPSFGRRRGHPIILDANFRDEIIGLTGGATMRDFLGIHTADIQYLDVDSDSVLRDMDTREEYEREIRIKLAVTEG